MATISEAAKVRACELANGARSAERHSLFRTPDECNTSATLYALATYIQQVSDAARAALDDEPIGYWSVDELAHLQKHLAPFILPDSPEDKLAALLEQHTSAVGYAGTGDNETYGRGIARFVMEAITKAGGVLSFPGE